MSDRPVTICLALHNGGAHVAEQLDSIARQRGAGWRLIVGDDGSRDDGPAIVRAFAARFPPGQVTLLAGPERGAAQNFLHLLAAAAPDAPLAFCDQDDVWLPHRLATGLAGVAALGPGPAIHCASTMVCDASLQPLFPSPLPARPLGLRHALLQSGGPGNTMLLSPEAVRLLQRGQAAAIAAEVPAHDWWAYLLVSAAGGRMVRDPARVLLYRQHGRNLVGRNDTALGRARRARWLLDGTYGGWLDANLRALEGAAELLTAESLGLVQAMRAALGRGGPRAALGLARLGLYRQSRAGTALVLAAAALGKLKP
ncbi:glycosyltransferase [Paracoccus sp. S-4012]|uniref:glycosyltransferase n=1 Tax=Paracoccus sp. S-4012 TaxID=2665648 RepID=UPI0012AF780F|nr:glycosyltransferase [Paracoccus sp. S-4012]MRX49241.1 glycosyltransferase [Paracoccus sp. S-4012]